MNILAAPVAQLCLGERDLLPRADKMHRDGDRAAVLAVRENGAVYECADVVHIGDRRGEGDNSDAVDEAGDEGLEDGAAALLEQMDLVDEEEIEAEVEGELAGAGVELLGRGDDDVGGEGLVGRVAGVLHHVAAGKAEPGCLLALEAGTADMVEVECVGEGI